LKPRKWFISNLVYRKAGLTGFDGGEYGTAASPIPDGFFLGFGRILPSGRLFILFLLSEKIASLHP
jgi:hypothetical protein